MPVVGLTSDTLFMPQGKPDCPNGYAVCSSNSLDSVEGAEAKCSSTTTVRD